MKTKKQSHNNRRLSLLLIGILLLSTSACGLRVNAEELSADYQRRSTEEGDISDARFKQAMADFSWRLFKESLKAGGENEAVSPLSAILCLGMIANGASGETKKQMEQAFGMDLDTLNRCLYSYTAALYSAKNCKVNLADSIWFRDGDNLQIREEFLQANADWYGAEAYAAPFDETTRQAINSWCRQKTNGMIQEILKEIPADTKMYLINALAFEAKWAKAYEKAQIHEKDFTSYAGDSQTASMLSSEEKIFLSGANGKGFAKSYAGEKYSFVGLLPDEGVDVYEYAASLDGAAWLALWNSRRTTTVNVTMPEFTMASHKSMKEALKAMGMTDMFDRSLADFSGITEKNDLFCSNVEQKVYVQVDRSGTKAAAITWGGMEAKSAPIIEEETVILDRPFVYAIVEQETGLPLFIGVTAEINTENPV